MTKREKNGETGERTGGRKDCMYATFCFYIHLGHFERQNNIRITLTKGQNFQSWRVFKKPKSVQKLYKVGIKVEVVNEPHFPIFLMWKFHIVLHCVSREKACFCLVKVEQRPRIPDNHRVFLFSQAMQDSIEGETTQKFYLYSGHDMTGALEIKMRKYNLNSVLVKNKYVTRFVTTLIIKIELFLVPKASSAEKIS